MLSLGHILISDLVTYPFMHSFPGMLLLYLAPPFLHKKLFCIRLRYLSVYFPPLAYAHVYVALWLKQVAPFTLGTGQLFWNFNEYTEASCKLRKVNKSYSNDHHNDHRNASLTVSFHHLSLKKPSLSKQVRMATELCCYL